ncbi:E3 ubiquitin-protein ligase RNF26 [Ambystoma mexicanum]|uniref:E3 ubiquitin-protein ligase RNF26 n=1 Tax=Ambystoma mexicanum TaxID=8296 RepID=UPI0037E7FA47
MELVFLVLHGFSLALNLLTFVLDLNFWLVSTLLRVIIWIITFVLNFPNALVSGLMYCWNTAFFSALYLAEMFCCTIVGSVHVLANMVRSFVASLESLKVIGHLSSHLVLRSKEVVHKGFMNLIVSGQSVLRQTCDVCTIIMSLVAYFVNSLVNMCLIGTQNLFSITLALWDTIVGPFLRFTELITAFLSRVSSSAIAMAILLWSPCQLAFEFLVSVTNVFVNLFLLNLYGLILLLLIITVSILVVNPALSWRIVDLISGYFTTVPSLQRFWRDVQRLHRVVLLSFHMVVSSDLWHRIAATALRMANWNETAQAPTQHLDQDARLVVPAGNPGQPAAVNPGRQIVPVANQRDPAVNLGILAFNPGASAGHHGRLPIPAVNRQPHAGTRVIDFPLRDPTEQGTNMQPSSSRNASYSGMHNIQTSEERPGTSQEKPVTNDSEDQEDADSAHNPWRLLKEQEERKMCVICQDHTKTVLLLPCRHLCLCCECTKILLQQPIYQRNCPLCRQMILQTLNVYL